MKNLRKSKVFLGFSGNRAYAQDSKITRKSSRSRFSSESRDRALLKDAFFDLASLKMRPETAPRSLGRNPGALLGRSWALLGRSWGALGRSLGDLGRSWDALGGLLDGSDRPLGGSLTAHGARRSILELPRVDFGASEGRKAKLRGT